jgi:hypothetical protein
MLIMATVRHRLLFLVGTLVTAAILAVLWQLHIPGAYFVLGALWLGLAVGSLIALNAPQPATFVVRAGTFTTGPSFGTVFSCATSTVLSVFLVGQSVDEARRGFGVGAFLIVALVLMALAVALQWLRLFGPFGLFLRPDGVFERQPLGSYFVPWEAAPDAEPTGTGITVTAARPDLTVRRGLRLGKTLATGADRGFTAWAINVYANQPHLRASIGTEAGLIRLTSL